MPSLREIEQRGQVVVTGTRLRTLTLGQIYDVVDVNNLAGTVRIMNDEGNIRSYQRNNFRLPQLDDEVVQVNTEHALPTPSPEGLNLSVPDTSPLRVVTLEDTTMVNAGGTAVFNSQTHSDRVAPGTRVVIEHMRRGSASGNVFLGIRCSDNIIRRYSLAYFVQGVRVPVTGGDVAPAPQAPQAPHTVQSSGGTTLTTGPAHITNSSGGHGLTSGTVGTISSIPNSGSTVMFIPLRGRETVVHGSRIANITQQVYDTRVQELEVLRNQETVEFSFQGTQYRVLSRDIDSIRDTLRRFTV